MLYISRSAGSQKWYVKDTDDGVETLVTMNQLRKAISAGLDIKGVKHSRLGGDGLLCIEHVEIYRDMCNSAKASKALFMQGVDILVVDDVIKAVSWVHDRMSDNVKIRLSQYGSSCENFLFNKTSLPKGVVTIILDDNIRVKKQSFKRVGYLDVVFDLREVTREQTARYVYETFVIGTGGAKFNINDKIIDKPERLQIWKTVEKIYDSATTHIDPIPDESRKEVMRLVIQEFYSLVKRKPSLPDNQQALLRVCSYVRKISLDEDFWRSHCQSYEEVYRRDNGRALRLANQDCLYNYYKTLHFMNYMTYMVLDDEIKQVYVAFVSNMNVALIDAGRRIGWLAQRG